MRSADSAGLQADDVCAAGGLDRPLTPDAAAARAMAIATPVARRRKLALLDAAGRVLAQTEISPIAIPPFDNSAMDGYAVRIAELAGQGPWRLRLQGRSAAGDDVGTDLSAPMSAMRILTGAPVPAGFDAVVMQEHCRLEGETVVVESLPRQGANIRLKGEDVQVGATLVQAGELLSPQKLALLAGAGIDTVEVFGKVRVGLVSTGSELRDPGATLAPGQIYNSNRILMRALLAGLRWVEVEDFGIVPDNRGQLAQILLAAAGTCDVLVSTGGVSAGDEDHVAAVLRDNGADFQVMRVAMRPGKPLKIGRIGDTLFAGLPGNPNAALATFCRIALPALRVAAGLRNVDPVWYAGVAGFDYKKKKARAEFVPVRIEGRNEEGTPVLVMLGRGSSASLSSMAAADGIAHLPADAETVAPGMKLLFERLPPD